MDTWTSALLSGDGSGSSSPHQEHHFCAGEPAETNRVSLALAGFGGSNTLQVRVSFPSQTLLTVLQLLNHQLIAFRAVWVLLTKAESFCTFQTHQFYLRGNVVSNE